MDKNEIEFEAILFKITTDDIGESKVTFCVSRQFLASAVGLNLFLEKNLKITVRESESKL